MCIRDSHNPVWHIHGGDVPTEDMPVTFNLLLNLVGAAHTDDKGVIWGFISQYAPGASPENHPLLDRSVDYAIAYYEDFIKPTRAYRLATEPERVALSELLAKMEALPVNADGEAIQFEVYEVGKAANYENLRDWFKTLYEILLGQSQGPRMGSFFALYGLENSKTLLRRAIAGEALG